MDSRILSHQSWVRKKDSPRELPIKRYITKLPTKEGEFNVFPGRTTGQPHPDTPWHYSVADKTRSYLIAYSLGQRRISPPRLHK